MFTLFVACALGAVQSAEAKPFTRIDQQGSIGINIVVDPEASEPFKIQLNGREEDIKRVEYKVENGTLIVRTKKNDGIGHSRSIQDVELTAVVKSLEVVHSRGSGDVDVKGSIGDFELSTSGSGDVSVRGEIGNTKVVSRGSGDLQLVGLKAKIFSAKSRGSGDMDVSGEVDVAKINMTGSGDFEGAKLVVLDEASISTAGSGDVDVCVKGQVKEQSSRGSADITVRCDG